MIRSAGIVVVRNTEEEWKYLFLRAYRYWDFPKGKVEEGESSIEAAIRETKEESGLINLDFKWGNNLYAETEPYGKKKKIARYYVAETVEEVVTLSYNEEIGKPEHNEYRWVAYEELKELACPRVKKVAKWARKIIEA